MADVNYVILIGRLTRDSELKYTNSGMAVSKFSLAVNRLKRSGDNWGEEASFFDCTMFGKRAEALNQYLTKGKQIAVEGELRQNRWEQDGQQRSKIEIVANNLQLLGGKGNAAGGFPQDGNQGGNQNVNQRGGNYPQQQPGNNYGNGGGYNRFEPENDYSAEFEDDIPF